MIKFIKDIFLKNRMENKNIEIKIDILKDNKKENKEELPEDFMDYLEVIFAKHLTKRDRSNIEYILSNIQTTYIENPKLFFNRLIEKKKLIEMLPAEKLQVFTINELKERFEFKKKVKRDIIQEILDKYSIKDVSQRTAGIRYKLSEDFENKYNKLLEEYENNKKINFNVVIKNIRNYNFLNILNIELKKLPIQNDLYNNIENRIPTIKTSNEYYEKKLEEYDKINMKKYINETENQLEKFKYYYFSRMVDSENIDEYFKYFLDNKYPNINYKYYNEKYFKYKRNIEKQIFEQFIYFLNNKISNQLKIKEYKKYKENTLLSYKEEIWNENCLIHKDKMPLKEEINEEIFCECMFMYKSEVNFK